MFCSTSVSTSPLCESLYLYFLLEKVQKVQVQIPPSYLCDNVSLYMFQTAKSKICTEHYFILRAWVWLRMFRNEAILGQKIVSVYYYLTSHNFIMSTYGFVSTEMITHSSIDYGISVMAIIRATNRENTITECIHKLMTTEEKTDIIDHWEKYSWRQKYFHTVTEMFVIVE